jgi:hypothetical protein
LKIVQNENLFFDRNVYKVFDIHNSELGIIFGNKFEGYGLTFYRLNRGMAGKLGLEEDFNKKCLIDLNTKLSGVNFQEKLFDLQIVGSKWIALFFERGIKILCLKKLR